jgi:hypothetical protein
MMLVPLLVAGSLTGIGSSGTEDAVDVICGSGLATLISSGLVVSLIWASTGKHVYMPLIIRTYTVASLYDLVMRLI